MIGKTLVIASASVAVILGLSSMAQAARPATGPAAVTESVRDSYPQEARRGCGSKGGPGYRKANGKCASWKG